MVALDHCRALPVAVPWTPAGSRVAHDTRGEEIGGEVFRGRGAETENAESSFDVTPMSTF